MILQLGSDFFDVKNMDQGRKCPPPIGFFFYHIFFLSYFANFQDPYHMLFIIFFPQIFSYHIFFYHILKMLKIFIIFYIIFLENARLRRGWGRVITEPRREKKASRAGEFIRFEKKRNQTHKHKKIKNLDFFV